MRSTFALKKYVFHKYIAYLCLSKFFLQQPQQQQLQLQQPQPPPPPQQQQQPPQPQPQLHLKQKVCACVLLFSNILIGLGGSLIDDIKEFNLCHLCRTQSPNILSTSKIFG